MNRAVRYAAVGVVAVALLAGGSAAAFAAPAHLHSPTPVVATAPAEASLTAKASATTVNAWQEFRISGSAKGIKAGTKVTVQQKQGSKWVSLPAQAPVNTTGTYAVRVKLGLKGVNQLRIGAGSTVSPVVGVTVR
jgi:asparagine N-glycosylation enzyme membrane subunit Stt3